MENLILNQFVDQETCLACKGCCRFKEERSLWRPRLLESEIQGIAQEFVDKDFRIKAIVSKGKNICSFLDEEKHYCQIYSKRPFECALYPFMVIKKQEGFFVAMHLACPAIQEKRESKEFDSYLSELKIFFCSIQNKEELKKMATIYSDSSKELEILFSILEDDS